MRSKKAILNIIWSLILQGVTVISGFIIPRCIIGSYGSNVNGLVSSITQFLGYIVLLESGFGPVVKSALYKPIANKDKKTIENILRSAEKFFRVIAVVFIVYLVVLAFVYPLIINTEFNFVYTMSLVLIISISTLAEYFFGMTYKLYLQADQKTYITSIIQIVGSVLNTIAIIILIRFGATIHIVKLVSGFIFVLRPIVQNIYVKKKYNINLKETDNNYELKQKWDGLAQHIASVIHDNTDVTILTIFTNMIEVSVYSIYYLVVKGIKSLIQAFTGGIDASFGDMIAKNEHEQLNKSFSTYELFYFTITTIVYICTMLLIVPFVRVYTNGITDADYIRPVFGWLLVISEFVWSIRLPYSSITLAAGHFKETRKGAWVEAIVNIVTSLILVNKFGIVGVAIGTLVAMIIRTVEFVYHTSKYILNRSLLVSLKKITVVFLETVIVIVLMYFIPSINIVSYLTWFLQAIITAIISFIVVIVMNAIIYKEEMKRLLVMGKKFIIKK